MHGETKFDGGFPFLMSLLAIERGKKKRTGGVLFFSFLLADGCDDALFMTLCFSSFFLSDTLLFVLLFLAFRW